MSKNIRVLIVRTDGTFERCVIHADLKVLQEIVGGPIEYISGGGWAGYCNEEGKMMGKPINKLATRIAGTFGWSAAGMDFLAGDVIFFGPADLRGDETDVPGWLVDGI